MSKSNTPPYQLAAFLADDLVPVTKSDTLDVWGNTYSAANSRPSNGLFVGVAGTLTIITAKDRTCTLVPFAAGMHSVRVKQVLNVGTATDVYAVP